MKNVTLYFNTTQAHFNQLYAGLEMLKKANKIKLNYKYQYNFLPSCFTKVLFEGKILIFDLDDSSRINEQLLSDCDFYVKRMLLEKDYDNNDKIIPFGLNFHVFYKNKYLKYLFFRDKKLWKFSLKYFYFFSKILNMKNCISVNNLKNSQQKIGPQNKIIFKTMLWDPDRNKVNWKKKERKNINSQRIDLIRKIDKIYSKTFIKGIRQDSLSEKLCNDIIIKKKEFHRRKFLKELKKCYIGIASQGLENSIGSKFSEYMAHSMAVLTSPISKFKHLGELKEGENFLVYNSTEECLNKLKYLIDNKDFRLKIQQNNYNYFKKYIVPDKRIENIFNLVLSKSVNENT